MYIDMSTQTYIIHMHVYAGVHIIQYLSGLTSSSV